MYLNSKKNQFLLLLIGLTLFIINSSFAQIAGDYRSTGTGDWQTTATWQTYVGPLATDWAAALKYPGQLGNEGSYKVTILTDHTVSINSNFVSTPMGEVIVFGILNLVGGSKNADIKLNTPLLLLASSIPITDPTSGGELRFNDQKVDFYLPTNAVLEILDGGNITGACSHNTEIYIGGRLIAVCNGGGGKVETFGEIVAGGGTLNANIDSPLHNSVHCQNTSQNLQGSYSGTVLTGEKVFFSGFITDPNGNTTDYIDTTEIIAYTYTEVGRYIFSFTVRTTNSGSSFSNTETNIVTVSSAAVGGAASSNQTICTGTSPSAITLTGQTGTIQWQSSSDDVTFTDILGATTSTLSSAQIGVLTATKYYRALVTNGACTANSTVTTVTVNQFTTWTESGPDKNWNNNANWSCGVPTINSDVLIPFLTSGKYPIISAIGDTGYVRNIEIRGGASIIIDGVTDILTGTGTGNALIIAGDLTLNGTIDLEGESQLLQDTGSNLYGTGTIEMDQQGTANSFNYNYWSSPVNSKPDGTFTIKGVLNDGSDASKPNKNGIINFQPKYWAADTGVTSPIIISTYWLYTFNGTNNTYSKWNSVNEFTPLIAGEGYSMKGIAGEVSVLDKQNYVFKGKPNNGKIKLEIKAGNDRLIGNPYPSAIDANKFILDNLSVENGGTNTKNIFNGALYFWDHFGEANSHLLKTYVGGYATRNLTAYAIAISNDYRINSNNDKGSKLPGQYIPVGQGFFVNTSLDETLTGIVTISGGDIVFNNSQRVFIKETSELSVFMKSAKTLDENSQKEEENTNTHPVIRLMYDSPTGYHRQIVMGMVENTTNHFDLGYDAPMADINKEDMFWTFDGTKFVIQGVPKFNSDQEFPLGLKIAKAGLATIKIDALENMDKNLSLHIKDKLTGKTHNISQKSFDINMEAGEYLDRFSLTFKTQKLIEEDIQVAIMEEGQFKNNDFYLFNVSSI